MLESPLSSDGSSWLSAFIAVNLLRDIRYAAAAFELQGVLPELRCHMDHQGQAVTF